MERWRNKIAVVTGVGSGIGWSIAKELLKASINVIGVSLETKSEEELKTELNSEELTLFHQKQCDLNKLDEIKKAFEWISKQFNNKIHILINNAGMCEFSKILEEDNISAALKRVIDANLMGAVFCTKESYKLMKVAMAEQEECHVININSLLGHTIMPHIPDCGFNLYPVAQHTFHASNEILRREMCNNKLLRLSSISPGKTETKFGSNSPKPEHLLKPEDITTAVMFILASPPRVNIAEMVIGPTSEVY